MDEKNNMNMHFMQVPVAPQLPPPMYPSMETQQHQLLPPAVFFNGHPVDNYQKQSPPSAPESGESRPASVFILSEKLPVGPEPVKTKCPHCNVKQISRVVPKVSLKTHFAALFCCVLGLICLVPVPYCMNAFKNLHHYCNNCGQYLGSHSAK